MCNVKNNRQFYSFRCRPFTAASDKIVREWCITVDVYIHTYSSNFSTFHLVTDCFSYTSQLATFPVPCLENDMSPKMHCTALESPLNCLAVNKDCSQVVVAGRNGK